MTPEEQHSAKSIGGKVGAHRRWSRTTDRSAATAKARAAFASKFEEQVDPDGTLPPVERARLAENARKAYFAELSLRRVQAAARRKRSADAARTDAGDAA